MTHLPKLFRALSDLNRLRILNILSHRSLCVCDLQRVLGLSQPFISRHLAYLRKVELVTDRRAGAKIHYSLALQNPLSAAVRSFLREAVPWSETFEADLAALRDCAQRGQLRSAGFDVIEGAEPAEAHPDSLRAA
jgi:ArsR family transcriptional regulator